MNNEIIIKIMMIENGKVVIIDVFWRVVSFFVYSSIFVIFVWSSFYVILMEFGGFKDLFVVCILRINVVEFVEVIKKIVIKIIVIIDKIILVGNLLNILKSICLVVKFESLEFLCCLIKIVELLNMVN